jgi:hypothetical protein
MHYQTTDEALRNRIKAAAQTKGLDTQKATSRYTAERVVDHFADAMGAAPTLLVGGLQYPQELRPTTDADLRSVVRYSDDELLRGCMRLKDILRPEGVDVHDVRIRELHVGLNEPVKRLQVQATVGGMRGNTQIDISSGYWGKHAWSADWTADVEHESFFKGGPTYRANVQSVEASLAEKWLAVFTQPAQDLRAKHHLDIVFLSFQPDITIDPAKIASEMARIQRHRGIAWEDIQPRPLHAMRLDPMIDRVEDWSRLCKERGLDMNILQGSLALNRAWTPINRLWKAESLNAPRVRRTEHEPQPRSDNVVALRR